MSVDPKQSVEHSGPWTYTRHDREAWAYGPPRTAFTIEDVSGTRIASGIQDEGIARLMAASPDLLAFAEWMATIAEGFYSRHSEIGRKRLITEIGRSARDVIAKATQP